MVSSTITIPAGTIVVGEAWSTIMGYGSNFQDYNNPQVVVKVGENSGDEGVAEITDMIFSTQGPGASIWVQLIRCGDTDRLFLYAPLI